MVNILNGDSIWWLPTLIFLQPFIVPMAVALAVAVVVAFWWERRCGPCGLSWAFEATGKERGEEVEWKCYACGDFKWKKVSSDDDNDWL